jgi:hypothetical protein
MSRAGWLIVAGAALTLSAYSLYWVSRRYGLPVPLAAIVSAAFDGAAIVCCDLSLKYARIHGDSGCNQSRPLLICGVSVLASAL